MTYGLVIAAWLVLCTLGEGGQSPLALLVIHAVVVAMLSLRVAVPMAGEGQGYRLARAPLATWGLFLVTAAAGGVAAPYGYAATLVLLDLGVATAVCVLAAQAGPTLVPTLAGALVWGGAMQGLLAAYQCFVAGQERPAGTFLNPNHLGAWLVAVVVLGLAGWDARPPSLTRLLPRALAALAAVLGIFLCGSRGALLGLAAALLVVLLVAGRAVPHQRFRWLLAAGTTLLLLAAVLGVVARVARGPDPFLYHRLRIWKAALGAVVAAPWTGAGPGQFKIAAANLNFPAEEGPLRYERFFVSPHSDLLRLPCELGWPATAAFALAAALSFVEIRRRMRNRQLPPSAVGAAAALVALGVQATVDDLTDRPAIYLLAAVLLGSLLGTAASSVVPLGAWFRRTAPILLVTAFVIGDLGPFLALLCVAPSAVWGERAAARDLPRGRLDPEGRTRLESALRRNPIHPDAWLRRAEDLAGNGSDWDAAVYARAREAAEHAIRLQPADARYRLGLARIERLACGTLFRDEATRDRAALAYADAWERSRHDPFLPLEAGRFLLAANDASGARRAAERALSVEPRAVPARLLLAEAILEEMGENAETRAGRILDEAQEIAEEAKATPKQTPYAQTLLSLDEPWLASIRKRLKPTDHRGRVASGASSS